jgi:hypothetical protein
MNRPHPRPTTATSSRTHLREIDAFRRIALGKPPYPHTSNSRHKDWAYRLARIVPRMFRIMVHAAWPGLPELRQELIPGS